jgi:hypothetical protein
MAKVAETYTRDYRAEFLADPEFASNPPKVVSYTSKDRLKDLWPKYADVFHYVLMWHVARRRVRKGIELECVGDGRKLQSEVARLMLAASRTKRLILPEATYLRFCTKEEYAAHKKIVGS